MTMPNKYPLIENLERVKRKKFDTPEQRLHAIVMVLNEDALSRYVECDSDSVIPIEIRIQSSYRWDVAGCVFTNKIMLDLMRKKEVTDKVVKSHLLCVTLGEVFYEMAATLFYHFYREDTGTGLTAAENNEIIKTVFGEQFDQLNKASEDWLLEFIPSLLVVHPDWTDTDPVGYTASQVRHYRTTYKDAFFMPHIEKAIQIVSTVA